jgi:thymidine kinase
LQNRASSLFREPQAGQYTVVTLPRRATCRHPIDAHARRVGKNDTRATLLLGHARLRKENAVMLHRRRHDVGWIEVVCGSMFSGKTEELIRRVRRAVLGKQRVQVFKPKIDARYDATRITSHSAMAIEAEVVDEVGQIRARIHADTQVVGIDEAQFFNSELIPLCQELANRGVRVVVAGLDQDYLGRPFEPIPQLLAIAEEITKCQAVCAKCGDPANHSQRLLNKGERIQVGAAEAYEARCRGCFEPG